MREEDGLLVGLELYPALTQSVEKIASISRERTLLNLESESDPVKIYRLQGKLEVLRWLQSLTEHCRKAKDRQQAPQQSP